MGGKDAGPGTEAKEGLGKDKVYPNPEFFKYNNYSYFDSGWSWDNNGVGMG